MRRSWSYLILLNAVCWNHCCIAGSKLSRTLSSASTSASLRLPTWLLVRGGSTATAPASSPSSASSDVHAYRLQQQLHLQSRSLQLRQALIGRGLVALQHGTPETTQAERVDWDCALATKEHPKTCLYSFDAEPGTKVLAPIDTTQWITLSALNRLRRKDPTKVEPLWHSQYIILNNWFNPTSAYSLYTYLTPVGALLSFVLDTPIVLGGAMLLSVVLGLLVTLPVWEKLAQTILLNPFIWLHWPSWARFVHAALPLKLLLGQMAWKGLATIFSRTYGRVRDRLIEWECQIWEECIPLTIIEDGSDEVEEVDEEDIEIMEEYSDEEDDDWD